ncbi:hypothetical protein [Ralstonia chuxiongensis]|uniref:Transmembrane protein n=1 Tax=Ralstonia chuxiongensis TaxID=2957504 RepID=A0AA41WY98_9RALS|nr:hypothetical protein [Ralstonia chuxiongensis]MCP1173750.1 hypothetical protein [Ralstonia chuxiongensis]
MTAIGFVLLLFSLGILRVTDRWDFKGAFELMLAGGLGLFTSGVLLIAGIATWLWHVMP